MILPDLQHSEHPVAEKVADTVLEDIRFYAGTALQTEDHIMLGSLAVVNTVPHHVSERDREILEDIAYAVMQRLEALRRIETLKK